MKLNDQDFALLKATQYCDNPTCSHYSKVGAGNLCVKSRKNAQIYCNACDAKPFSVAKGTMFFGLRTPIDKIISVLGLLSSGIGANAIVRETGVTKDSLRAWLVLAANHVNEFTAYIQQNMSFDQVQIDEFWSFIRKKRKLKS